MSRTINPAPTTPMPRCLPAPPGMGGCKSRFGYETIDILPAPVHIVIKGVLCQKPLAVTLSDAQEIVRLCREAGIKLGVNQNMRYDQSIRALKILLGTGELGTPVLATIEMRAVPHWQTWLRNYGRLTLLNMSIHHLD